MLGELAVLYRAMQQQAISPIEVDEMELWQVAVMLGADEDHRAKSQGNGQDAPIPRWEDINPGVPDPIYGQIAPAN